MVPVCFHPFRAFSDHAHNLLSEICVPFIVTSMHENLLLGGFHLKKEKEPDGRKGAGLKKVHHFRRTFISLWNKCENIWNSPFDCHVFAVVPRYFLNLRRLEFLKKKKLEEMLKIVMRCLTMGTCSEKCIVKQFHHCANVTECPYTHLDGSLLHI